MSLSLSLYLFVEFFDLSRHLDSVYLIRSISVVLDHNLIDFEVLLELQSAMPVLVRIVGETLNLSVGLFDFDHSKNLIGTIRAFPDLEIRHSKAFLVRQLIKLLLCQACKVHVPWIEDTNGVSKHAQLLVYIRGSETF